MVRHLVMSATILITAKKQEDVKEIVAFLTKFGQVKSVMHGAAEAFVYQPIDTVQNQQNRIVEVKSNVYKVTLALVDLPSSDFLKPLRFHYNVRERGDLPCLAKKKAEALKRILREIDMFHQVREECKSEIEIENITGTLDMQRQPPPPKS